ncbi:GAF domain-containing protein [Sporomusa sp.]|jgi:transcriptional regulator with PAS, ATPase and Fis domain|uniref:GAF domain-containing protein n=1 Tax=Sporomusa sp. TaxID=2078658 RepID=UPI002CD30A89|nr:helix-turn-helix domain-containing protein [Sporomusa sp.]HWR09462.1 helix-turn-helix domain-containing protein [Sporomusa sp.]
MTADQRQLKGERMSALRSIEQIVQRTAEALKEVLKIDVEVVDTDMIRIASTGACQGQLGQVMVEGFVYQHVLKSRHTVVIENAGTHPLCDPCPKRGQCVEDAEMAAPIMLAGEPVGVIGLVSFDPVHTERLMKNRDWMLHFIEKMAELIAGELAGRQAANGFTQSELSLNNLEKEAIMKALAKVNGQARSKEKAAEMLGISRATLYRKLKEYKIS